MSLIVKNLSVSLGDREILKNINLEISPGTLHAVMGPNGSGKSTLAQILMGNPNYKVKSYLPAQAGNAKVKINEKDIINLKPDERAREGLFLAFQNPISIPGVSVANLLRTVYQFNKEPACAGRQKTKNGRQKKLHNPVLSVWEFNEILLKKSKKLGIPQEFLKKSLNEAFSGGEKKKLEMLQAIVLSPKYAIFDEIDTGLDVDALRIVATAIDTLKKENTGVIVITHYQRILRFAHPDFVHILVNGKIVESGSGKLALEVEKNGYKKWVGDKNN